MTLQWSKNLSLTDAQQETKGRLVPYLRFTKSNHHEDTQKWFREVFFKEAAWKKGYFGKHAVEEASVKFRVSIQGKYRGERIMKLTHDYDR